ncbi:hypothetical protein BWQ96_04103 [Gracilariopsis chorda]|uniref:Uncharacterized protein n=1 Tax=Gracilariopsis chorda TaxID=448386 RepID=A0A2V3IWK6_9FLOR|nr:hypothetical protein BWQ96_04103 [Gracilariopsis chorda]|eukprot:PXF46097.1 hypothetical protein BWQ96_04103 [Gracilariopsis chorda]
MTADHFSKRLSHGVYHSHSRSRNLLSLPLYPSDLVLPQRRQKSHSSLACPISRSFRSAALLLLTAFAFFVFDVVQTPKTVSSWNTFVPNPSSHPHPTHSLDQQPSDAADVQPHLLSESEKQMVVPQPTAAPSPSEQQNQLSPPIHLSPQTEAPDESTSNSQSLLSSEESNKETAQNQKAQNTKTQNLDPDVQQQLTNSLPTETSSPQNAATDEENGHTQTSTPDTNQSEHTSTSAKNTASQHEATAATTPQPNQRDPTDFSNFDSNTALNYFHLHKTGGVSFKERLFDFFNLENKVTSLGKRVNVLDTCHMSGPDRPALGIEAQWSCDWGSMEQLSEAERDQIDVILGHQYWEKGAEYWVPNRDLRYFTVMRHPLHRKISFFYHFFVRNAGKKEESVQFEELIRFIVGKDMPESTLIRDAGPNYYASRLCSDGFSGFENHMFRVDEEKSNDMVRKSIERLRRKFVFIGLQTQEKASLCMLRKSVAAFSEAHGIEELDGLELIDKARERMNSGSYSYTGKIVWEKMSEQERNEFKRVEKVDLAIYQESVKMFDEMVRKFGCRHLVRDNEEDSIGV